ncbi:MAG: type IX secretion system membrane protein PorP/SprF [Bacteroidota bacterium]
MRSFLPIIILIVISLKTEAQQEPQLTYYMFNNALVNPGASGNSGKICATALQRNQWIGLDGAPVTFAGNVNAPFNLFGASHGAGLSISNDVYGFNTDLSASLAYAFQIEMGDGNLGIGISGGFINNALNDDLSWEYTDGSRFHSPTDPAIPEGGEENVTVFSTNAGVFYSTDDLYLGISTTRLLEPEAEYLGTTENTTSDIPVYSYARHYFITAGYTIMLPNPSFEIKPSVLIKSDGSSAQIDINTMVQYNKKIWGGVSLRNPELAIMGGLELTNNLKLGLAYGLNFSKLITHNSGSVEIMLNYCFEIDREKTPQKYRSIRYL